MYYIYIHNISKCLVLTSTSRDFCGECDFDEISWLFVGFVSPEPSFIETHGQRSDLDSANLVSWIIPLWICVSELYEIYTDYKAIFPPPKNQSHSLCKQSAYKTMIPSSWICDCSMLGNSDPTIFSQSVVKKWWSTLVESVKNHRTKPNPRQWSGGSKLLVLGMALP